MLKSSITTALISIFFALPTLAQSTASVFAPPSNIRNRPNGEIICTVTKRVSLNVYQQEGEWYYTNLCGGGYIHKSQISFQSANSDSSNLTDRARVVGLEQGLLDSNKDNWHYEARLMVVPWQDLIMVILYKFWLNKITGLTYK